MEAEHTGKENQMTVSNRDRAEWASAALGHFQSITGTDHEDSLSDLLGDLHHWCDRENVNFQNALDTARTHYQAECAEENSNAYMVMFRTTAGTTEEIFAADAPEQALELARKAFNEIPGKFGFSPAECGYLHLQEIRIVNQNAEEALHWMTDEYRLQLYAPELLKALESQVDAARKIVDAWDNTDRLPEAVQDLIDALEHQTEAARAVIDSWEQGDLAGAVHGLEMSLDESLAALARAKGGAV